MVMITPDGRTRHYAEFFGVEPADDDRPLILVLGNCQAEALRVVLDSMGDLPYRTMRIPAVHELSELEARRLHRVAAGAQVLLSQPIRTGYRGLPIGTDDVVAALPIGATVVRWPVIRFAGLYPFQVIVRHPSDMSASPAVVPYHDLRTVSAWSRGLSATQPWDTDVSADSIRAVGAASVAELARREARDADVGISDALVDFGADAAHTINHPGNGVLELLAARIVGALGVTASEPDVDRVLLRSVIAPLEARVLDAIGSDAPERLDWTTDGHKIAPDDVHRGQMDWYDSHPEFVTAAIDRHRDTMDVLGLAVGERL